jgi:hypothetical protein
MERRRAQNSSLLAGLVLIVLGLFFFAGTQGLIPWNWLNLDWSVVWPVLMILIGAAILAGAFSRVGQAQAVAGLFGSLVVMLGAFFFATTLGYIAWEDQGTLWPINPLALGLAFLVGYLLSGLEQRSYLISGLIITPIALILLLIALTNTYLYLSQAWPLALILVGVLLLVLRPNQPVSKH